jgi:hypothetical protein
MGHKILAILIICMVLSVGCAPLGRLIATPTPGYYPDLFIRLDQIPGMCVCSSRLEINGDGDVSFQAGICACSLTAQKSHAKITPQQIEELVAAINRTNVWAMKGGYSDWQGTDMPTASLSITLNGRSKTIGYGGYCHSTNPFCRLVNTIAKIVNSATGMGVPIQ